MRDAPQGPEPGTPGGRTAAFVLGLSSTHDEGRAPYLGRRRGRSTLIPRQLVGGRGATARARRPGVRALAARVRARWLGASPRPRRRRTASDRFRERARQGALPAALQPPRPLSARA